MDWRTHPRPTNLFLFSSPSVRSKRQALVWVRTHSRAVTVIWISYSAVAVSSAKPILQKHEYEGSHGENRGNYSGLRCDPVQSGRRYSRVRETVIRKFLQWKSPVFEIISLQALQSVPYHYKSFIVSVIHFISNSKLCYDRLSIGQSILASSPHLGLKTRFLLLSDSCGFVNVRRPLRQEDRCAVYNCCWSSSAQSFSSPNLPGLITIFHCLRFETPATWRARSPYLYPPGTGWPSYTLRHWVPFHPLLRLARLRRRYSKPPPRGETYMWYSVNSLYCDMRLDS
jgi:hypothetical protein